MYSRIGNDGFRLVALLVALVLIAALWAGPVLASDIEITASPAVAWPTVESSAADNITDSGATLHGAITDVGSANATVRGFEWGYSPGSYTYNWTEEGNFGAGTFSHWVGNLTPQSQVCWRAFAINPSGRGNSTERCFVTIALPDAPTDFTVTPVGNTIVQIDWTMGARADTTVIRCSSTGYPSSITDGYLVYSGNETSVAVSGLNLDTATYYYRAWSHNDHGYSTEYAEGWAGNPLGIPALMFVIGLCVLALWRRDWIRPLLAVCIVIWGAFAFEYDVKIAGPLIGLGVLLFVKGLYDIMKAQREEREGN